MRAAAVLTLALTENIRTVSPPAISVAHPRAARHDGAIEGVLVFCGISFALAALSVVFGALSLPSAFLF
jgi:hypothetical protein